MNNLALNGTSTSQLSSPESGTVEARGTGTVFSRHKRAGAHLNSQHL